MADAAHVSGRTAAGAPVSRQARLWQALALVLALFVLEQNLEYLAVNLNVHPWSGSIREGVVLHRDRASGSGVLYVDTVKPGSALDRQGVRAGAVIVPDKPLDTMRPLSMNETIGATVIRDHKTTHVNLIPQAKTGPPDWFNAYGTFALTVCLMFALLLILASRGRPQPLVLGVALAAYAEAIYTPLPFEGGVLATPFSYATSLVGAVAFATFLVFALSLHEDAMGRRSRSLRLLVTVVATLVVVTLFLRAWAGRTGRTLPLIGDGQTLEDIVPLIDFALVLAILADAYRRSRAEMRRRYSLLLIGFAMVVGGQGLSWILQNLPQTPAIRVVVLIEITLAGFVAPALFAYAILRQKVMDVAFALNRTLVYGVVSLILLVSFGLLEWAVEHFAPIQGREKNAFIDAGLALVVFLAFHRVRDATEHVIEALFFRRWQRQEAELKRFLREAPFITRPEALTRAAVGALERFADGARAAIYLRDDTGDLRRLDGDLQGPERIDANHPALVSLRAQPKPVELDGAAGLDAALAAPMLNRNDVTGAILFGPKPDAGAWRPDELALIGQAAVQIGQDLHVLEVERLDRLAAELKTENTLLKQLRLAPT